MEMVRGSTGPDRGYVSIFLVFDYANIPRVQAMSLYQPV